MRFEIHELPARASDLCERECPKFIFQSASEKMKRDRNFAEEFKSHKMDVTVEIMEMMRGWAKRFNIPDDYELFLASAAARLNQIGDKYLFLFYDQFMYGLSLPLFWELVDIFHHYNIISTMLTPNSLSVVIGVTVFFDEAGAFLDIDAFNWFV